ncbi:adhesion G-protein coupled receptor G7-like [Scophthalmus maximus]|uniref:adhesion G-protein coupled receptor G7-like n=1 Tax=Scophthalmus maximus TaxID=52904 RepID=UPI001FA8AFDC|nr:adhesion G-protein coupled receptor G7-like [Scophthalmus maximus]
MLLGSVCICPDEWTGQTCSKEYFCKAKTLDEFTFPSTPVGWFSYSEEVCGKETNNAGKPQAVTRCSLITNELAVINQTNIGKLALNAQILTSRPEELTTEDVTAAAQIANKLLGSAHATESVRVAAVATVSQLLNTNALDNTEENNDTLELTKSLDKLSVNFSSNLKTTGFQVVQPNLVVQSVQVPAANTQGVQFTSLTGTSGSFVANRIRVDNNTATVVVENGSIADALIHIQFHPAVNRRQELSDVSLGFVLYQNARLFRSRLFRRPNATVRVLSGTVSGLSVGESRRVEMWIRPTLESNKSLYDFSCVSYDYNVDDWSVAGCSKGNASDGVLRCSCNHTTNFAVLFSVRQMYTYADALDWISTVGLSLSFLGLMITIIHHIGHKNYLENYWTVTFTLLCICFSLLLFIITFVSGVVQSSRVYDKPHIKSDRNVLLDSDQRVEPDSGSCTAVAALLHFFLLATFMWISLFGTISVLQRKVNDTPPPYWTPLSVVVGWGFPAVFMAISLGATYTVDDPLGYRQEEFCWLAALDTDKQFDFSKPMFWAFVLPVALTLIYNIAILVLVSWRKYRAVSPSGNGTSFLDWWKNLQSSLLPSSLLGVLVCLSWSLGYAVLATTGHAHLVFSILFCLLTTSQGFMIFILFTAIKSEFKSDVLQFVKYFPRVTLSRFNLSNIPRVTFSRVNLSNFHIPRVTLSRFNLSNIPPVTIPRPGHMGYKLQTISAETSSTETYRGLRDEDTSMTTRL